MHLEVDLNSPFGIKGLTEDMKKMFTNNDIDKNLIKENPQAMIQIMAGLDKAEEVPDNALLSNAQFEKEITKI